jgi:MOSC domain-containing protein YiiM
MTLLNPDSLVGRLLDGPMRPGTVTWIGVRPVRRQAMLPRQYADLDPVKGLDGDHYRSRANQVRQITVIQSEHIAAIAAYLGVDCIAPDQLRRNFVVSGINLRALRGRRFRIGSAVCMETGECHPCSRMEDILGPGGYNAVRGHGGITARIISSGQVRIGDEVTRVDDPA